MQQRLSVCSWLTGSCWGQIQGGPVSWAGRASRLYWVRHVGQEGGKGNCPLAHPPAPVESGGRLLSGSSLSQDCARRVLLGFRGAVRRPGSKSPEMIAKAGPA